MTYTVKQGDTLESIAEQFFGDRSMVGYLASINNIQGESMMCITQPCPVYYPVQIGQELNIGTPEVTGKKWNWILIITITSLAGWGIYKFSNQQKSK